VKELGVTGTGQTKSAMKMTTNSATNLATSSVTTPPARRDVYGRAALALLASAGTPMLVGCNYTKDSFFDPSVAGRWEYTPTVVPILDRIVAIEDEAMDVIEFSDPVAEDLVPQPMQYRLGAGDILKVTLWDLVQIGQAEDLEVTIDQRGFIELPQLGRVAVEGLTVEGAIDVIKNEMTRLVSKPLANVSVLAARQQTFTLFGAIEAPGTYQIPRSDYRLLEAITSGGQVFASFQTVEYIYIIRQIPLASASSPGAASGSSSGSGARPAPRTDDTSAPAPTADELMNIINDVAPAAPDSAGGATRPDGGGNPGLLSDDPPAPVIDLPDARPGTNASGSSSPWVFVDGKWVEVARGRESGSSDAAVDTLIAQRIIRINYPELLNGRPGQNVIVRSGDVIRIPTPLDGIVFLGGEVARPGPFQIPATGGLTLTRAIDSAGGFGDIAIPEKIELTRMIGRDRQATIMLDGRAIFERTQPDILLKNNDHINVGTTFWALPLAVIRNGFRASYGFGFVLDRNIANDIFGPPPVNQFGQ
jgi:polysaccharide biosynthesis/export protein